MRKAKQQIKNLKKMIALVAKFGEEGVRQYAELNPFISIDESKIKPKKEMLADLRAALQVAQIDYLMKYIEHEQGSIGLKSFYKKTKQKLEAMGINPDS